MSVKAVIARISATFFLGKGKVAKSYNINKNAIFEKKVGLNLTQVYHFPLKNSKKSAFLRKI